jgi:hypothetical protein
MIVGGLLQVAAPTRGHEYSARTRCRGFDDVGPSLNTAVIRQRAIAKEPRKPTWPDQEFRCKPKRCAEIDANPPIVRSMASRCICCQVLDEELDETQ